MRSPPSCQRSPKIIGAFCQKSLRTCRINTRAASLNIILTSFRRSREAMASSSNPASSFFCVASFVPFLPDRYRKCVHCAKDASPHRRVPLRVCAAWNLFRNDTAAFHQRRELCKTNQFSRQRRRLLHKALDFHSGCIRRQRHDVKTARAILSSSPSSRSEASGSNSSAMLAGR